jgi:hypothetical protein
MPAKRTSKPVKSQRVFGQAPMRSHRQIDTSAESLRFQPFASSVGRWILLSDSDLPYPASQSRRSIAENSHWFICGKDNKAAPEIAFGEELRCFCQHGGRDDSTNSRERE